MVTLRDMLPREFPPYKEYFIDDYAREIVENYGHSMAAAISMAKKDLESSFPYGPVSDKHTLLCIEVEVNQKPVLVGYLWHCKNTSDSSTYIYDFYIYDAYRGKGYGKQAIGVFEKQLQGEGIGQIKLRVAYENKRALKLYEDLDFKISGYNMSKNLETLS